MLWLYTFAVFLPFALYTSYSDVRFGRIPNRAVFLLALAALAYNSLVPVPHVPTEIAANSFFMLIVCLTLWALRLFTPGDAKLLWAYATFLPPFTYRNPGAFPSFDVLVNTFVPFSLMYAFITLKNTSALEKKECFRSMATPKFLAGSAFNFAFLLALMDYFRTSVRVAGDIPQYVLGLMLALLLLTFSEKAGGVAKKRLFLLLAAGLILVQRGALFQGGVLPGFLAFLACFYLINLSKYAFSVPVRVEELREGMVPAVVISREGSGYRSTTVFPAESVMAELMKKVSASGKELIVPYRPEGLTRRDIEVIIAHRSILREVMVRQSVPFAPLLAVGTALTIIFSGSVFQPAGASSFQP